VEISYRALKKIEIEPDDEIVIFCTVGDEIYFLPHFLDFYRKLGVNKFYILVDHSTDGTLEYLQSQDDCAIFLTDNDFSKRVNLKYGEKKYSQCVGTLWKTLIPKQHLQGKWVLIVDADEFLQLPPGCEKIQELTALLEKNNHNSCRALMIDFFPKFLKDIKEYGVSDSPFSICPFFDPIEVAWDDNAVQPKFINTENNVRNRIVDKMLAEHPAQTEKINAQKIKWQFKTPLIKFNENTIHIDAHRTNHAPPGDIQCVLAHFKFQPHWERKVDWAIESKAHYLGSLKYQPLGFAKMHLQNWNLLCPHSVEYRSKRDLENNNLIFNSLS